MAEEGKKISFGFSKSVKRNVLKKPVPQEEKKVDYIECIDEKAIKVVGGEDKKDEPLVIPMLGSKTWHDRIINKIDADIFEPKIKPKEDGNDTEFKIKQEPIEQPMELEQPTDNTCAEAVGTIKTEIPNEIEKPATTLEDQAAQEILEDLKKGGIESEEPKLFSLVLSEGQSLKGERESTLEDYENIPIDAFGTAMLRGMGWTPGKGIGKNEKLVEAAIPELRPKGMGLGADKVAIQKLSGKPKSKEEEQLKVVKGAFVKIIAGKAKDSYGQIEGLDDDAGRLIVKMAIGGDTISVNEFMVVAVTQTEYSKNAKVLNAAKYEQYKNKDAGNGEGGSKNVVTSESEEDSNRRKVKQEHKERRKVKKHRRQSSGEESSPDRKSRKRRDSSSSETERRAKKSKKRRDSSSSESERKVRKSKKSKKHKSRDSSAERSSKKNKKKDKEREKRRDKRYSESPDRRKHRKHKRSRSRSPKR